NWDASGALGPYRIGPNMMVVVPTANDVELTYGRSNVDWMFTLLTVVGIGLCIFWRMRGDVRHVSDVPVFGPAAEPDWMLPPAVEVDHDPWDPQRFEPHGIAEEDRWIRPQSAPVWIPPESGVSPRADSHGALDPPEWAGDEPGAPVDRPVDPTR
ncbi:MAG TPA: hypothetical protein VFV63_17455, partial [Ilumatobacteraceae bacterium]|nr:hypothetical protein [Ilumatobacteraceae bacterium]